MKPRKPTDGKPFYCTLCGAGYAKYLACEEPICRLESAQAAEDRAVRVTGEPGKGVEP